MTFGLFVTLRRRLTSMPERRILAVEPWERLRRERVERIAAEPLLQVPFLRITSSGTMTRRAAAAGLMERSISKTT
jgi:hypothetical protein